MQCDSCGIQIGPDYMETWAYQVDKYSICGWCYRKLQNEGHIELDGRHSAGSNNAICKLLYPDGSVKRMRLVLDNEARFVPLKEVKQ